MWMFNRFMKGRRHAEDGAAVATSPTTAQGATAVLDMPHASSSENGTARTAPDGLDEAFATFRATYPTYEGTAKLDELRATDYARLDRHHQVYLDYTGGGLYAESQLRKHMEMLNSHVLGNPHSSNPTSAAMTDLVESARAYVLTFFNASPDEYEVIFTLNASGALKLVGESYPFEPGGKYLLTFDNHNSVNGIREFAGGKGASVVYSPVTPPDLRIDEQALRENLAQIDTSKANLFAFPAQSNFSGMQHPLAWVAEAKALGWDVLLDAAAFTPTNRLDLGRIKPDFVSLSFYKIIGYPTGIGALIARKEVMAKLHRPWYAGGTIIFSSVLGHGHNLAPGPAAFEDGTLNYLSIPAVEIGLRHIDEIGIETIHERVRCLAGWVLEQLTSLRHSDGSPVVVLYGTSTTEMRGGTITFNIVDRDGNMVEHLYIEKCANAEDTSLRTGCFCNPGAREQALHLDQEELEGFFRQTDRMTMEQFMDALHTPGGDGRGAVRISLGVASNFADAYTFVQFMRGFIDR
jgi:molybdenum cofactor sulfurtransferase